LLLRSDHFVSHNRFVVFVDGRDGGGSRLSLLLLLLLLEVAPQDGAHFAVAKDLNDKQKKYRSLIVCIFTLLIYGLYLAK
jgi:hypothetical protein